MGLCKCPKKKVTNLFCFEHRINVCEHCLVANHSQCVVQSYLQWLQDSDYSPICSLCNHKLQDDDQGECVRLLCYDVFHWKCLDAMAQQMPPNTAPAGYECPCCRKPIIPKANHAGPVAEALRERLTHAVWARVGLGLSTMMDIDADSCTNGIQEKFGHATDQRTTPVMPTRTSPLASRLQPSPMANGAPAGIQHTGGEQGGAISTSNGQNHSVLHMYDPVATSFQQAAGTRKVHDSNDAFLARSLNSPSKVDHDDDKYKRRPALSWLFRLIQSHMPSGRRGSDSQQSGLKRFTVLAVLFMIGFFTLIAIMSSVGRRVADSDPMLDPNRNPNIIVRDSVVDHPVDNAIEPPHFI